MTEKTQGKDLKNSCSVPIIELTKESAVDTWSSLVEAIRGASYVALDLELSGLGNRAGLSSRLADDRYKFLCEIATSYSVLSCGICCCTLLEQSSTTLNVQLSCITFNILLHCQKPYLIEPQAVRFLLFHGFDFNKQYSSGLPYWPGDISLGKEKNIQECPYDVRTIFELLIALRKPVVLHNGLVDLVFFYQAFYTKLPASLATFTADLSEIFAGGIYDTKTIAVFEEHEHATYLEYIFRKCQRDNDGARDTTEHKFVDVQFTKSTRCEKWTEMIGYEVHRRHYTTSSLDLCPHYVKWGFCSKREKCGHIHDVDLLLDKLEQQAANKRRRNRQSRKRKRMGSDDKGAVTESDESTCHETSLYELFSDEIAGAKKQLVNDGQSSSKDDEFSSKVHFSGHRAGFDAFMTAYSFAVYFCKRKIKFSSTDQEVAKEKTVGTLAEMESIKNRIVISGKPAPLLVAKSHFAKTSHGHQLKLLNYDCISRSSDQISK